MGANLPNNYTRQMISLGSQISHPTRMLTMIGCIIKIVLLVHLCDSDVALIIG